MPSLYDPAALGRWQARNRFVVAPMTTYSSQPSGHIADDEVPYLQRRAEGGFGVVMTAACAVHPRGKAFDGQWACWNDDFLPSLKRAADAIRIGGALSVLQIHHGGRQCPSRLCGGAPLSASAVPADRANAEPPQAMSEDEIEETIAAFGGAARRAVEAGFDGIEIHGANTYLLQQFVSPHSNRREDAWGRDRLAFSRRVIEAVIAGAGGGAFIGYRFSPEELETPGIRWEETSRLIELLCGGGLDFLHASLWDFRMKGLAGDWTETTLERVARAVAGRKPLIGVGQVKTLADAEECQGLGADLVALGRAALSQPDWPIHAAAGHAPRIKIPKTGAAELLTWPKGLEDKAYNAARWFEIED